MRPLLSVIAPVFTDETRSVRYAAEVLARSARAAVGERYEILFVDDGSAPSTLEELRNLASVDPRVRWLGDGRHHGLGTAFRWGLAEAAGDYVLYTDGDGQVACAELGGVWMLRGHCDFVLGYRTGRREGWLRHGGTRLLAAASAGFLGQKFRDVDCAFKLARADFLKGLGLRCKGTGIDAEIVLKARRRGARILEIPVEHAPPDGRRSRVTIGRVLYGACEFLTAALLRY